MITGVCSLVCDHDFHMIKKFIPPYDVFKSILIPSSTPYCTLTLSNKLSNIHGYPVLIQNITISFCYSVSQNYPVNFDQP